MLNIPSDEQRDHIKHKYTLDNGNTLDVTFYDIPTQEKALFTSSLRDSFLAAGKYGRNSQNCIHKETGIKTYHILGTPYFISRYENHQRDLQRRDIDALTGLHQHHSQAPAYCGNFSCRDDERHFTIFRGNNITQEHDITSAGIFKGVIVDPASYLKSISPHVPVKEGTKNDIIKTLIYPNMRYFHQKDIIENCALQVFNSPFIVKDSEFLVLIDLLMRARKAQNTSSLHGIMDTLKQYFLLEKSDFLERIRVSLGSLLHDEHDSDEDLNSKKEATIQYYLDQFLGDLCGYHRNQSSQSWEFSKPLLMHE